MNNNFETRSTKKILRREPSPIKSKENSINSSMAHKNIKTSTNQQKAKSQSSVNKKKKEFSQLEKETIDEIEQLWYEYQNEDDVYKKELKLRLYLINYDMIKDTNYTILCLSEKFKEKNDIILQSEKIWMMHIEILMTKCHLEMKYVFAVYKYMFQYFQFSSEKIKCLYMHLTRILKQEGITIEEFTEQLPKEFLQYIQKRTEKHTEKKNDIKRCLTPRPNIKKNLFTSEFNVETDLQKAKLLSNSKKKYNFAVFELEESVQKKMGLKYLITPVKEKIDKSFVKEELKSIHQKYDDVYYLPYIEQLSEKIIQKNSRITFGKIDFDNISNE